MLYDKERPTKHKHKCSNTLALYDTKETAGRSEEQAELFKQADISCFLFCISCIVTLPKVKEGPVYKDIWIKA